MESQSIDPKSLRVYPEKCTGCRQCVLTCSFVKTGKFDPNAALLELLSWEEFCLVVPIVCNQCEDRPCEEACMEGAISFDTTGILVIDKDLCTTCELCMHACPTASIVIDPYSNVAVKCDLCGGKPACVSVCYPEALQFEPMSWPERQAQQERQIEARRAYMAQELPGFPVNVSE